MFFRIRSSFPTQHWAEGSGCPIHLFCFKRRASIEQLRKEPAHTDDIIRLANSKVAIHREVTSERNPGLHLSGVYWVDGRSRQRCMPFTASKVLGANLSEALNAAQASFPPPIFNSMSPSISDAGRGSTSA